MPSKGETSCKCGHHMLLWDTVERLRYNVLPVSLNSTLCSQPVLGLTHVHADNGKSYPPSSATHLAMFNVTFPEMYWKARLVKIVFTISLWRRVGKSWIMLYTFLQKWLMTHLSACKYISFLETLLMYSIKQSMTICYRY